MSTIDRRRLLGPQNAQPLVFAPLPAEYVSKVQIDKSKEDDINDQISRTFLKSGLIKNANGSAYSELDGNIMSVSIYGPRPIRGTFVEKTSLNIHIDDSTGLIDDLLDQKFSNYIDNTFTSVINLSRYPKSGIDIFVNIISVQNVQDLSLKLLSLISDTTTLALINADIEIIDIVASAFDLENNTVASFVKENEIVAILSESQNSFGQLDKVIDTLQKRAKLVKNGLISYVFEQSKS